MLRDLGDQLSLQVANPQHEPTSHCKLEAEKKLGSSSLDPRVFLLYSPFWNICQKTQYIIKHSCIILITAMCQKLCYDAGDIVVSKMNTINSLLGSPTRI